MVWLRKRLSGTTINYDIGGPTVTFVACIRSVRRRPNGEKDKNLSSIDLTYRTILELNREYRLVDPVILGSQPPTSFDGCALEVPQINYPKKNPIYRNTIHATYAIVDARLEREVNVTIIFIFPTNPMHTRSRAIT